MAKKSRAVRMTAAKKRPLRKSGGRGAIKKRAAGRNIMKLRGTPPREIIRVIGARPRGWRAPGANVGRSRRFRW